MRTLPALLAASAFVALLVCSCVDAPQVVQGTVTSYDPVSKTLLVKDDLDPLNIRTFSLQGAEVGADPLPEDHVRVAYRDVGGRLTATRVMNLTRQKELAARGSGGH